MTMTATLTSKGQTTIPKAIRDYLKLTAHDQIIFRLENNKVVLEAKHHHVDDLFGKYKTRAQKPISVDEMNRSVATMLGKKARA